MYIQVYINTRACQLPPCTNLQILLVCLLKIPIYQI
nr:MAG TPA: hypothetical protein [Bacteriophage sp.]